jgi:hypothetical protein
VLAALILAALAATAAPAQAAPPPNDAPTAPAAFEQYTAENGRPTDLQAIAELQEATPDPGVPRCLGPDSFARTAWYTIPPTEGPQEITVEASGETLDVVDLAAFVQPANGNPASPQTQQPNVCDGRGAGGASDSQEPTSGLSLTVPGGRAVLIQVGRRGPIGTPQDERVVLSLDDRVITAPAIPPAGDFADARTPTLQMGLLESLPLFGATITQDDPAQPPCPSLGSIWRKVRPSKPPTKSPVLITANGSELSTLTVFGSPTPTGGNVLDCVSRAGRGALKMLIPAANTRKTLWVRLGTDEPVEESVASLRLDPGRGAFVADGGPGGFDPTPGGPGGGLPSDCAKSDAARARIGGTAIRGNLKRLNKRGSMLIPLKLSGSQICDVELELAGPRGRVYASTRALRIKTGLRFLRLARRAKLVRGGYTLRGTALSGTGEQVRVRSTLKVKLT